MKKTIKNLYRTYKKKGVQETRGLAETIVWWKFRGEKLSEKEMRHPGKVQPNKIVFESYGDYGDNSRALSDYMIANGYGKKYDIVWIVDNPENYKSLVPSNIRLVPRKYKNDKYTLEALREIHTAKYVFYTVALNWAGIAQNDQIFINLWHGCSFKGNKEDREVFFDYCLVPSPFFQKLKMEFFNCKADKILPIGYPRNDLLKKENPKVRKTVKEYKRSNNCKKLILWLPTYRKSKSKRLNERTLDGSKFNMPILFDQRDLLRVNETCAKNHVMIVIKQHRLHNMKKANNSAFNYVKFIDDIFLENNKIQLYELLHESDALITDYSSVGVDYLLTDKPIGYTLDDYYSYKESRGFTVDDPLDYMPGENIFTVDDLIKFIEHIANNVDDYRENRENAANILLKPSDSYCQDVLNFFEL